MSPPDDDRTVADDGLGRLTGHIVEIWRVVLREPNVHPDSHLFDLGATSLAAVRIKSGIRAVLGREIELVDILEHPSPRELAAVVRTAPEWEGRQPWQQLDWSQPAPNPEVADHTEAPSP